MLDTAFEIIGTLKRNKLRTALTGFAVSWGIFILIILLGAGNGLSNSFTMNNSEEKLNTMRISPGWTSIEYEGLKEGRAIHFVESDLNMLRSKFSEYIEDIDTEVQSNSMVISHGKDYVNSSITATTPLAANLWGIKILSGRFINQQDMANRRKLVIISERTAETLFPDGSDPIGEFLTMNKIAYKIVGLYKADSNDGNPSIYIPFNTYISIYSNALQNQRMRINVAVKNLTDEQVQNEFLDSKIRQELGKKHRFNAEDSNAMWIWNRLKQHLQTQAASVLLTNAIWIVGILTLLSGIVGVSNIMLITVKERTREFGIRKALGAKPYQILSLIVTESIVITTFFGYIGMVCGIGVTEIVANVLNEANQGSDMTVFSNPTIEISTALYATLTLIIAGTLAGFFPAKKATNVKPIEAMRG